MEGNAIYSVLNRIAAKYDRAYVRKAYNWVRCWQRHLQPPTATYTNTMDKSNYLKLKSMLKQISPNPRVLEVGCSPKSQSRNRTLGSDLVARIIKLDIVRSSIVDIVADAHRMPIADNSFHGVLFHSEIEHMHTPDEVIAEIGRVLIPGGLVYSTIPFVFYWHHGDYYRFSKDGLRQLFRQFEEVEIGIGGGPSSALAWVLRYYLSILLSFRSATLFGLLTYVFGWLTFPLKYLDIFLQKYPKSEVITSGFYCFHSKPIGSVFREASG